MKEEKETKQKLLASAKEEFMEKGYMKASLRNICKNAGVTTGALYFFFQDKEDLFGALVEEPLKMLFSVMESHYEAEADDINQDGEKSDFADDYDAAKQIIHFMYQYYDEFQMILTKAQGSKYEYCVDHFVELSEQHYKNLVEQIERVSGRKILDAYTIHWFSHMQIDIFVKLLTHEPSEEAALQHLEIIMKYLIAGWNGLISE
ncbi:MAG: TetR/AcrR family transcriptional regulator [Lachnospiraceae bacterium]